jgi:uncharacterized membrane protein
MIESPLALATVLLGLVAAGFLFERRYRWAETVGASLLVIAFGAVLSNLELVPLTSPVYGMVTGPVTSLAIAWLLLSVDLAALKTAGPRMLGAFAVAVAATAVGAVVASLALGGALGEVTWKLAGVMTGTYSGGSLNFVSVGRTLELPDSLFTAATASDNVVTALWMGVTLTAPLWLARFFHPPPPVPGHGGGTGGSTPGSEDAEGRVTAQLLAPVPLRLPDLALLGALGLALLWAAEAVAKLIPAVPSVIWLTTFALAAAQIPAVQRLDGALHLGTLALNLFFVVIGIGSKLAEILAVGLEVFWFTALVVAVHGVLVYGLGKLLRLDALTLSIASQAAVGGPSTALAVGVARGREDLALPGVMVGLLGYAIGTYLGLAVAAAVAGGMGAGWIPGL